MDPASVSMMSDSETLIVVDCVNDTGRILYDRSQTAKFYLDGKKYSQVFELYVRERVVEEDRSMMLGYKDPRRLMERLDGRDEYRVIYQVLECGVQRFYEMHVMRYSDAEVLLSIKERSSEVVNRMILDRLENAYDALFSVNLDTGMMQVLKDVAKQALGVEGTVREYTPALMWFASTFGGEAREFFEQIADIGYIKRHFAKENRATFIYQSGWGNGRWRKATQLVLIRHDDGTPWLFVLALSKLDDEAGNKAELQMHLKEALDAAVEANRRNETLHRIIKSAFWSIKFDENRAVTSHEFAPELFDVFRNKFCDIFQWAELVHPADRNRAVLASRATLHDPNGATALDIEYRVRASDGSYHWVRSAAQIILNPSGSGEMYGFCADVDEQVRRREEELRMLDEAKALEQASEAKSRFFSMVSHDIRTPLNAIIGYAELLKLGMADEKERETAVNSVLVSGKVLLDLINDVLDLSKLEAGKMAIIPEPADARMLVKDIVNAFKASAAGRQLEIRMAAPSMPWLRFDPHRVRQILFNLVGNAVKFTEKGFVEIRAEYVRTSMDDGHSPSGTLQFEVRDTGCGIPEEDLSRIDQPYVQVGSRNRHQGTGLGLAICKQLVTKMGGSIKLESRLGEGTTVRVVLPDIVEEDSARRARLSATQKIQYAIGDGRSRKFSRVLVVDDQLMNRMVLKNMLSRFGVDSVELVENGMAALEKLRAGKFDLVLTDMWMPEMDGNGLVREIRRNPEWGTLPVYAITADVEAMKRSAQAGFTGILLKPITLDKLKALFEG